MGWLVPKTSQTTQGLDQQPDIRRLLYEVGLQPLPKGSHEFVIRKLLSCGELIYAYCELIEISLLD